MKFGIYFLPLLLLVLGVLTQLVDVLGLGSWTAFIAMIVSTMTAALLLRKLLVLQSRRSLLILSAVSGVLFTLVPFFLLQLNGLVVLSRESIVDLIIVLGVTSVPMYVILLLVHYMLTKNNPQQPQVS